MLKPFPSRYCLAAMVVLAAAHLWAQSVTLSGLRTVDAGVNSSSAIFSAVQLDSTKNIFLLLDEGDGIRILKLNAAGTSLLASIHLGAAGDHGTGMVLDSTANVYVTGITSSGALATTAGAAQTVPAGQSSFVAGFNSGLVETFLTSTGGSSASTTGIAINDGAIWVTGTIATATLPVTGNAIQTAFPGNSALTGFVEAFNTTGTMLSFSSYLGGANGTTSPTAIAADTSGNVVVTGADTATGYPTLNAAQPELVGSSDMFLTKFSVVAGIEWSTLLGSSGGTVGATSVAIGTNGTVFVGANATALGLPITQILMPLPSATNWAIVFGFSSSGAVISGQVLGDGQINAITLDSAGNVVATGSINDPAGWPLLSDPQHAGTAFLADLGTSGLVYSTRVGAIAASGSNTAQSITAGRSVAVASDETIAMAGAWTALAATSGWLPAALDLPLVNAPNSALAGTLTASASTTPCQSASATCSVAYIAEISPAATQQVSLSVDTLPNLSLRNEGGTTFTITGIAATGYTSTTDCIGTSLAPAAACNVVLTGNGPGTVAVTTSASNTTFPVTGAALSAAQNLVQLQPRETVVPGFGPSSTTAPTVIASNPGSISQVIEPSGNANSIFNLYPGTCTGNQGGTDAYLLAAASTCTLNGTFNNNATNTSQDGQQRGYVTVQITGEPVNVEAMYGYRLAEGNANSGLSGLLVSTTNIAFGMNYLGQSPAVRSVVLANASSSPVTPAFVGSPAGDPNFVIADDCPVTLPAYGSCVIQVTYAATVTSTDATTLTLPNGATLTLSGSMMQQPGANGLSANPSISVSPASLMFGAVGVGDATAPQSVTISNSSSSAIAFTLVTTGGFTETNSCNGSVAAESTCSVQVAYSPNALGVVHGQLAVTPAGSSPVDVALAGGGTNTLNFGSIAEGSQSTQWISLGSYTGNVTASTQGEYLTTVVNGYNYSTPPQIQFTTTATGSCTSNCYIGVVATPTSSGTQSGTLTITESTNTITYPLTAAAVSQSALLLSSYSLAFGTTALGSSSAQQFVSVENAGTTSITISSIAVSNSYTLKNGCGSQLSGGASCVLAVAFTPGAVGTSSGTLTVAASGAALTCQLSGNAASNPADLGFAPSSVVFASPSGASTQTVTITNNSSSNVVIGNVSATGTFYTASSNCGALAASGSAGNSCSITLASTGVSAGTQQTSPVTFTAALAGLSYPYQLQVSAVPTSLGVTSDALQVVPASLSFATQAMLQASSPQSITVTNSGSTSQSVLVTTPAQFSVDNSNCATLAAGSSCTMPVRFIPFSGGVVTGTLLIQGNGADLNVPMSGTGLAVTQLLAPAYPPLQEPVTLSAVAGGDGTTQLLNLTNAGSQPLTVSAITAANLITGNTCTSSIAAGASCSVTLQTTLNSQCGNQCNNYYNELPITVLSNAASSPDVFTVQQSVSGENGATTMPGFALAAASLTFPQTALGSSATQTFLIESTGSARLNFSLITSGPFLATNNCSGTIAGYSGGTLPTCTVTVKFTPTTSGFQSGTIQLETNAGLQTVTLGGNGPSIGGPEATTTTMSASAYSVAQGQPLTLYARIAPALGSNVPTGTATFYYGSTALLSELLVGGTASVTVPTSGLAVGTYPLYATYGGDSGDLGSTSSSVSISITAPQYSTVTTLALNPATVSTGGSVTFTANVARNGASGYPGGTVQFHSGGTLLGSASMANGNAVLTISTSGLGNGTYSVTATYEGDTTDLTSTATPVTLTVSGTAYATQTVVTETPASIPYGGSTTLQATVSRTTGSGPPTGTVSFYYGTYEIGTATLVNGSGSLVLGVGTVSPGQYGLTATYSGDANDVSSTSAAATLTIQAPTQVTLAANPSTVSATGSVTFTATIVETVGSGTPGGSVAFEFNGGILSQSTVLNGIATWTVSVAGQPAGTYPITAAYLGDNANETSSSAAVNVTIQ